MKHTFKLCGFCVILLLSACAGARTFHEYARPGDTVAVGAGWKHTFSAETVTVTITASTGEQYIYSPGDQAVRGIVNLYPDPVSSLVVSEKTGHDMTPYAGTYADMVNYNFTDYDRDWWQTTVFVDLPPLIAEGQADITITSGLGETVSSTLEIIPGDGTANTFSAELSGPLTSIQFQSLERADHFTVSFSGTTVPYAMQLAFSHDPAESVGGQGVPHVINPRGDLKNISWTDDGINLSVIVSPANLVGIDTVKDCKFYVSGGITHLNLVSTQAVDIEGNDIPDINVSITE